MYSQNNLLSRNRNTYRSNQCINEQNKNNTIFMPGPPGTPGLRVKGVPGDFLDLKY